MTLALEGGARAEVKRARSRRAVGTGVREIRRADLPHIEIGSEGSVSPVKDVFYLGEDFEGLVELI